MSARKGSVARSVSAQSQRNVASAERSVPRSVDAQSQRTVCSAERSVPRSVDTQSQRTVCSPERCGTESRQTPSRRGLSYVMFKFILNIMYVIQTSQLMMSMKVLVEKSY